MAPFSAAFQYVLRKNLINCPYPNSIRNHPPTAVLDLIFFILIVCCTIFIAYTSFSYIFTVFSLIEPCVSVADILFDVFVYTIAFVMLVYLVSFWRKYFNPKLRVCGKEGCLGLWNCLEHNEEYHDEETLINGKRSGAFKEYDELPYKGGNKTNLDYESTREQLRQAAPTNGRAVIIFRRRCGCAYAKLEGWGPKDVRRPKKSTKNRN